MQEQIQGMVCSLLFATIFRVSIEMERESGDCFCQYAYAAIYCGHLHGRAFRNGLACSRTSHEKAVAIASQIDDVIAKLNESMTYIDIDVQSVQDALGEDFYDQFDGDLWPEGTMKTINDFKASYAG